jgi:hypothetical protein
MARITSRKATTMTTRLAPTSARIGHLPRSPGGGSGVAVGVGLTAVGVAVASGVGLIIVSIVVAGALH